MNNKKVTINKKRETNWSYYRLSVAKIPFAKEMTKRITIGQWVWLSSRALA
jgi:hypothetical protein